MKIRRIVTAVILGTSILAGVREITVSPISRRIAPVQINRRITPLNREINLAIKEELESSREISPCNGIKLTFEGRTLLCIGNPKLYNAITYLEESDKRLRSLNIRDPLIQGEMDGSIEMIEGEIRDLRGNMQTQSINIKNDIANSQIVINRLETLMEEEPNFGIKQVEG